MIDGQGSMVSGQVTNGRWSVINGQWSNGQWSMVNVWSMVNDR